MKIEILINRLNKLLVYVALKLLKIVFHKYFRCLNYQKTGVSEAELFEKKL